MASNTGTASPRLTIGLLDKKTGWAFRLHSEAGRCWLDSFGTGAPVSSAYVAGANAGALELTAARCRDIGELVAVACRLVAAPMQVLPLGALDARLRSGQDLY